MSLRSFYRFALKFLISQVCRMKTQKMMQSLRTRQAMERRNQANLNLPQSGLCLRGQIRLKYYEHHRKMIITYGSSK